jgi:hypothetical protein
MSATPPNEPTIDELLERISRLEAQVALQARRQSGTEAEVRDLGEGFKSNVTHNSDHFQSIYKYLADIHTELWPLVHKVFPDRAKTQDQIANIIRNGSRAWDDKNPHG